VLLGGGALLAPGVFGWVRPIKALVPQCLDISRGAEECRVRRVWSISGMIQADCVSDLMSQGVSDVADLQIAVEADLPALEGIEADQRLCDRLNVLWRVGIIGDVSECPALWLIVAQTSATSNILLAFIYSPLMLGRDRNTERGLPRA
jgi:hypothetical protein